MFSRFEFQFETGASITLTLVFLQFDLYVNENYFMFLLQDFVKKKSFNCIFLYKTIQLNNLNMYIIYKINKIHYTLACYRND